jgi:hypothetical protein
MAEFDIKAGGFKGRANLDIDLENMILSIVDKFDEKIGGNVSEFYTQNKDRLSGILGLGKVAMGKSIDPPLHEEGQHSFGIRDLNLDSYPTGVYGYNTDNFNLKAEVGPEDGEDGWRAGVRGTYNFADGGFTGDRWGGVRDAAWIEGRDWYRGPSGEEIPISPWRRPRDQPIHPEKIKHLESINDREPLPQVPGLVPLPSPGMMPGFGARARPLPGPDIWSEEYISGSPGMPEDGGEVLRGGGGFDERANAIGIDDNLIPPRNTGIRANTGSPAPSARTPQQPLRRGPTSSNPRNPYISSVANHPLVSEPSIPFPGGGLSSLDRVGWGHF